MAKDNPKSIPLFPDGTMRPSPPGNRYDAIAQREGDAARAVTAERRAYEEKELARFNRERDASIAGPLIVPGPKPIVPFNIADRDARAKRQRAADKKSGSSDWDESDED